MDNGLLCTSTTTTKKAGWGVPRVCLKANFPLQERNPALQTTKVSTKSVKLRLNWSRCYTLEMRVKLLNSLKFRSLDWRSHLCTWNAIHLLLQEWWDYIQFLQFHFCTEIPWHLTQWRDSCNWCTWNLNLFPNTFAVGKATLFDSHLDACWGEHRSPGTVGELTTDVLINSAKSLLRILLFQLAEHVSFVCCLGAARGWARTSTCIWAPWTIENLIRNLWVSHSLVFTMIQKNSSSLVLLEGSCLPSISHCGF